MKQAFRKYRTVGWASTLAHHENPVLKAICHPREGGDPEMIGVTQRLHIFDF